MPAGEAARRPVRQAKAQAQERLQACLDRENVLPKKRPLGKSPDAPALDATKDDDPDYEDEVQELTPAKKAMKINPTPKKPVKEFGLNWDHPLLAECKPSDDECKLPVPQTVVIGMSPKYQVGRRLGKGGFGQVFLGTKLRNKKVDNAHQVAIKFEHKNSKGCTSGPPYEWQVYGALATSGQLPRGIPKVHFKGEYGVWYVMIMDVLGPSLWDVWNQNHQKLDEGYVACVAVEVLHILESLHQKGYVHGDIKPENLLLGRESTAEEKRIYLVDLGLAAKYIKHEEHIRYEQVPDNFRGTIRYASTHSHLGRTSSRRDDLESLVYTLVFLVKGRLPWQGFQGDNKAYMVCKKKMQTNAEALCRYCHPAFRMFADHVFNLRFDDQPCYRSYIGLFEQLLPPEPRPVEVTWKPTLVKQQGTKRTRDMFETCPPLPEQKKKIRIGCPVTQWITVYDKHLPMKQRYHYNVGTSRLEANVRKGYDDNMMISCASACGDLWALIMDARTGYTAQCFKVVPNAFLPKDWIVNKWDEGYHITAVAGSSTGSSLVVMSKGTRYTQQSYKVHDIFPFEWIKKKWRQNFYITSIATSGTMWAVVMSLNVNFVNQVIELDFQYPSEGIHKRWEEGYRITAIGATAEQSAFVMSIPRGVERDETQETLRTAHFPAEHVREKWARDLYIGGIAFGRTNT